MEFSPALAKSIREDRGLNRVAASRAVGLSRQGLVNIEDGISVPGVDTLGRMADAYEAPVEDFFIDADASDTANTRKHLANDTSPDRFSATESAVGAR